MIKIWFVVNAERISCSRRVNRIFTKKEDFLTSLADAPSADLLGDAAGTTREMRALGLCTL